MPNLENLIGLDRAKATVEHLLSQESGVHAVLLYGSEAIGKSELARRLVEYWIAPTFGTADQSERDRKAMGSLERGNNPDLLVITPQGASNMIVLNQIAPGGAKDSEKLDVTPLTTFVRTLPLMSAHKVVVIEDAHRMNGSAKNSLLKPLEEPLPHVKLVLMTTSVASLGATILSRCLAVACDNPGPEAMRVAFPDAPTPLLVLSDGSPGLLVKFLEHPKVYLDLVKTLDELKKAKPADALRLSETLREHAEEIGQAQGLNARNANATLLGLAATYLRSDGSVNPAWVHQLIDAHAQILQNGQASLVFDAMIAQMLVC